MTRADLHAIKVIALNLDAKVRAAERLPLLSRAAAAMEAAGAQAVFNIRLVGLVEFLSVRLSALEAEKSGGASTNEVQDGERGQGKSNLPVL